MVSTSLLPRARAEAVVAALAAANWAQTVSSPISYSPLHANGGFFDAKKHVLFPSRYPIMQSIAIANRRANKFDYIGLINRVVDMLGYRRVFGKTQVQIYLHMFIGNVNLICKWKFYLCFFAFSVLIVASFISV